MGKTLGKPCLGLKELGFSLGHIELEISSRQLGSHVEEIYKYRGLNSGECFLLIGPKSTIDSYSGSTQAWQTSEPLSGEVVPNMVICCLLNPKKKPT